MASPTTVVTIFGGSGFIGRYVTQRLAREGWRIRVAVRRPEEGLFVRPYGAVGQVEPVQANIRDDASTQAAIRGADVVINCVGILGQSGKQTFDAVVAEGAARIARFAAEEGGQRLVHVSAIGADAGSDSAYARAKAQAEKAVQSSFPDATILRPSVVFGTEDEFFNRFASMARFSPALPVVGPDTRFQPVYVDDVAAAVEKAAKGEASPGIYELGGPEAATFRALMERLLKVIERKRFLMVIPFGIAALQGRAFDLLQSLSLGLFTNGILTADQVALLKRDNVVTDGARTFADLGIEPTPMEAVLEGYLYSYRPHGQYDAITASAENLRNQ
ncbi:MAG: complex I NDUFA9 subunit family protein [Pseudomonadota bacterium]